MRNGLELIETLQEKYPQQYKFLKEKVNEVDEKDEHSYFLGIRNGYLKLYYKGMSMAEIRLSDSLCVTYEMDKYYRPVNSSATMTFEEFSNPLNFEYIKERIRMHVSGEHDGKMRKEKVCQQWIINKNNEEVSDWYFIDMEYVFDAKPYGRSDMIAVKRRPNCDGKHEVALVELKIGNGAYKGLDRKKYSKKQKLYEQLQCDLYDESSKELRTLKYGSGLVSHIVDFMRFLKNSDNYKNQMRKELADMILVHKKLGLITEENELFSVDSFEQLAEKPDIYLLSYSYTPTLMAKKKTSLSSMKTSFFNHLYTSEFCLKNMLNREQIEGILGIEEIFWNMRKKDRVDVLECMQRVGDEEYRFIFQFKDADSEASPAWRCLG